MTTPTIAERVTAGAAFLDEHDPDWWRADVERAIDLDGLDLAMPDACILGQRCPVETLERYTIARYGMPLSALFEPESYNFWALASDLSAIPPGAEGESEGEEDSPVVTWSRGLGFNSATGTRDEYDALTAEWRRVITERRSAS